MMALTQTADPKSPSGTQTRIPSHRWPRVDRDLQRYINTITVTVVVCIPVQTYQSIYVHTLHTYTRMCLCSHTHTHKGCHDMAKF